MGRCTPIKEAIAEKTPTSDKTGHKVSIGPCNCITFDELNVIIKNNNTEMPKPRFISSSSYEPYEVPDELLMAIIAIEAPCQGNKYVKDGVRIDIEFDPCAQNDSSSARGLTQLLKGTLDDFFQQGIITGSTVDSEYQKLCGNAELAVKYGSWNIQLKYLYKRKEKQINLRLEKAVDSAGTGTGYGKARIHEMELLKKNYSKETILGYKK